MIKDFETVLDFHQKQKRNHPNPSKCRSKELRFCSAHACAICTNTARNTPNNAETVLCFTADIWQQRCGRIDEVNSWLNSGPDPKVIQAAAGTSASVSCHSRACGPATPWHTGLQQSRRLTTWHKFSHYRKLQLSPRGRFIALNCLCVSDVFFGWTNYTYWSPFSLLHGCLNLNTSICVYFVCIMRPCRANQTQADM